MKNNLISELKGKPLLLSLFATVLVLFSCERNSEEPDHAGESKVQVINIKDIDGTWLLKGNSTKTALVNFKLTDKVNGYTIIGGYRFRLIEYEVDNGNYSFHGYYQGSLDNSDLTNEFINIPLATTYIPIVEEGKPLYIYGSDNVKQSFFNNKKFKIEKLTNDELRISYGDNFFVGSRFNGYEGTGDSPRVGSNDYADLGLPVLWAKCNIGASYAEDYGWYVGWGDPTGKKTSTDLDDYPCSEKNLPQSICATRYDVASVQWGNKWRIPTYIELEQLNYCCIQEETRFNGISGYKYSGITGQSIFIPFAGCRKGDIARSVGKKLSIWSGERFDYYPDGSDFGKGGFGDNGEGGAGNGAKRYLGCTVRAVCDK